MPQNPPKINPDQEETPKKAGKPRILVAPLDWGLGHATRCVPLIRELLAQGADVWLAGEGAQTAILTEAFPLLPVLELPGYRIRYARTKWGLPGMIALQVPRLLRVIKSEHEWLKRKIEAHQFDAVISDNRYGLYHKTVPCIFITHQLTIKTGFGKGTERWLQKLNYRYINRFRACWVPDHASAPNLAGTLSHPFIKPGIPVQYTGPLSRFEKKEQPEIKNHLLLLLSGPEPQRTLLEEKIIEQVAHYPGTATVVRGLPAGAGLIPSTNQIRFFNHLPADALTEEMLRAEWVISRSGYSTLMELAGLRKKSILIPTPGQTEQEYLARYHRGMKTAFSAAQNNFSLAEILQEARGFSYHPFPVSTSHTLRLILQQFLDTLQ
ncbi:MAG: glycosyl transferase family 28 [Sphingobacteriales bacterium]|nr:glycosyl transferase family 28 [Sphingobacteriales bacterium]